MQGLTGLKTHISYVVTKRFCLLNHVVKKAFKCEKVNFDM